MQAFPQISFQKGQIGLGNYSYECFACDFEGCTCWNLFNILLPVFLSFADKVCILETMESDTFLALE